MKKLISFFSFLTTAVIYLSFAVQSYAQSICPNGQFSPLCNLRLNGNTNIVGNLVTILLIIAIILALFFLIWGSIRWITSGGDKGKLDGARSAITASLVGLILAFLAYFILNVVVVIFTGNSASNLEIPTLVP